MPNGFLPWPASFHKQKLDTPLIVERQNKRLIDWSWYFADFNIAGWQWPGFWANCIQSGALRGADLSLRIFFCKSMDNCIEIDQGRLFLTATSWQMVSFIARSIFPICLDSYQLDL